MKSIVIIGATGLVGAAVLEEALSNPDFAEVTALTRKNININHEKLKQIILPKMSSQDIESLELEASTYFCALGTTIKVAGSKNAFKEVDLNLVLSFAKLAKKSNAQSLFIVSAMGASSNSNIFYNKIKGEMEQEVSAIKNHSTYFLRPSLLVGERTNKRFMEEIGISFYKIISNVLPKKVSSIIGTKIEDMVQYFIEESKSPKQGLNVIKDFHI